MWFVPGGGNRGRYAKGGALATPEGDWGQGTGAGERDRILGPSPTADWVDWYPIQRLYGELEMSDGRSLFRIFLLPLFRTSAGPFFFFYSVVTVTSEGQREGGGFRPANCLPPGNPSIYILHERLDNWHSKERQIGG